MIIGDGTHLTGLSIKMTPQGMIFGRVTDEDGDSVRFAQVHVFRLGYGAKGKELQNSGFAQVQPDNSFVVGNLVPGRYYLTAADNSMSSFGASEQLTGTTRPIGRMTTFYPNASDFTSATPIDVGPGAEVRGIDIRLLKGGSLQIHGRITGLAEISTNIQNLSAVLSREEGPAIRPDGGGASAEVNHRDGSFVFRNVFPGSYVIQVSPKGPDAETNRLMAYSRITVADQDAEITLAMGAGQEVTGAVKLEEGTAPPVPVQVILVPAEHPAYGYAQTEKDGSFHLYQLAPERYRVLVDLPQGTYVKYEGIGGRELSDDVVDLSSGSPGPIEIVLSSKGAELSGIVRNAKGNAISNALVALWKPPGARFTHTGFPQQANTDQAGSFTLRAIPPGEYLVAAWEDLEMFGVVLSSDFRAHFEGDAAKVTLGESARSNIELKAIDSDTTQAEIAKLP